MLRNQPGPDDYRLKLPETLTKPSIPIADRIRARAENVAVQIQEIFPLKELHNILEENYAVLADGKSIDITLSALGIDPKALMTKFANIKETKIADHIRDFLIAQGPIDGMIYEWADTHTLASVRISVRLMKKEVVK